jgi:hypothetical protein
MKIAPDDIWMRVRLAVWTAIFMTTGMVVGNAIFGEKGSFWGGMAIFLGSIVLAIFSHKWAEDWWRNRKTRA